MDLLPYISIRSDRTAALSEGTVLNATVQEVGKDDTYTLLAKNLVLKLSIPLPLEVGDRVTLKVRSVTPQEVVFDVSLPPPSQEEPEPVQTLLERLNLDVTPQMERLVAEFVRMNAPIDRELLTAVRADTPAQAEATAFLAAHGIEPTQAAVDRIAALSSPAPEPADPNYIHQEILKAFAPQDSLRAIDSPPPASNLQALLDQSPALQILDRLASIVSRAAPEPEAKSEPAPSSTRVADLTRKVDEILALPPREAEAALEDLKPSLRLPEPEAKDLRAYLDRQVQGETARLASSRLPSELLDRLAALVSSAAPEPDPTSARGFAAAAERLIEAMRRVDAIVADPAGAPEAVDSLKPALKLPAVALKELAAYLDRLAAGTSIPATALEPPRQPAAADASPRLQILERVLSLVSSASPKTGPAPATAQDFAAATRRLVEVVLRIDEMLGHPPDEEAIASLKPSLDLPAAALKVLRVYIEKRVADETAVAAAPPAAPDSAFRLGLLNRLISMVSAVPPDPEPLSAPRLAAVTQRLIDALDRIDVILAMPPKEAEEALASLKPSLRLPALALKEVAGHLNRLLSQETAPPIDQPEAPTIESPADQTPRVQVLNRLVSMVASAVPEAETPGAPGNATLSTQAAQRVAEVIRTVDALVAVPSRATPETLDSVKSSLDLPAPALKEVRAYLEKLISDESSRPQATAPPLAPLKQALDQSPKLRLLDRIISLVSTPPPEPESAPVSALAAQRLNDVIRKVDSLLALPRNDVEAAIEELKPALNLPAPALRQLRAHLERLEIDQLSRIPMIEEARQSRGTIFQSFDRLMTHRLVNQLAALRDQGIGIYEMVVPVEGRSVRVPIRVIRREGRGRKGADRPVTLTLDVEFTRLGRVRASLEGSGKNVAVRFRVRDGGVRDLLAAHAGDLVEALRALGLEASVGAEIAGVRPESPLTAFAAGSAYVSLDLRA